MAQAQHCRRRRLVVSLASPTCAGKPSGTLTRIPTGTVPMVCDSTNVMLYLYVSGAWKSAAALT